MTKATKRVIFLRKLSALISYATLLDINFIITNQKDWLSVDITIIEQGKEVTDSDYYNTLGEFWLALGGAWSPLDKQRLNSI